MALEAERIYPHCPNVIRVVPIGGLTKAELLAQLQRNAILLNEAAAQLFASHHFTTSETPHDCTPVELTVRALGFPHGAITAMLSMPSA
jgi:hypothetical protein